MKNLLTGFIALFSFTMNAQNMKNPNDVVTKLFVSADQRNWPTVEKCFAEKVLLDYSSMSGSPAATLVPSEIVNAWKGILPGFDHTHHQLGNFVTSIKGDKTQLFCYGTATHFLKNEAGNVWTVVGSYDFELMQTSNGEWRVSQMKFNFKYQDGNTSLPEKAIEKVNSK